MREIVSLPSILCIVDVDDDVGSLLVHGWDYRRHVISSSPSTSTPQKEFEYTTSKIMSSFSNFSAWHYRSTLLRHRLVAMQDDDARKAELDSGMPFADSTQTNVAKKMMVTEFELVRQALYTDPSDQSSWFYHRALMHEYPSDCKL